ncbi:MlaD family protein [Prosthecobacter sp.]|uniref:MlaD family protein n=1 Tax=Prosthecobacter sp. TaxID=1965333 RepID=UPI0037851D9B
MKQSKLELYVGLFVLLGIAAVVYLTVKLGSKSLIGGDTYVMEARFTNAGGLNAGSSVLLAGVPVGRVEGIRVDGTDYTAMVTLRVEAGLKTAHRHDGFDQNHRTHRRQIRGACAWRG